MHHINLETNSIDVLEAVVNCSTSACIDDLLGSNFLIKAIVSKSAEAVYGPVASNRWSRRYESVENFVIREDSDWP